jgi:uncharacterized protein GlcG (DUF336 family)
VETIYRLTLADAKRIAQAAEMEANLHNWEVVIAIVDQSGYLMYMQRDNAQLGSIDVAIGKAKTALLFRCPTKALEKMVSEGKQGYLNLNNMVPVEGGVPLLYNGQVVGAIGVSGVNSSQDGQVAKMAASAL